MSKFREPSNQVIPFQAGADLSAKRYHLVKLSSGKVVLGAAATDIVVGVLQNDPKELEGAAVRPINASGTGKVHAGGAITVGARLTCDSNGQAIVTTTQGNRVFGIAMEAADEDDIFEYMPVTEVVD